MALKGQWAARLEGLAKASGASLVPVKFIVPGSHWPSKAPHGKEIEHANTLLS